MTNIGVFDSGLGGLTVLKSLIQSNNANYFYLGDSNRAPYGSRDEDEIIRFADDIVGFLENYDIDQYVIACNTISVLATDYLAEKCNKNFIPITKAGLSKALEFEGDYLILATEATVNSHFYKKNIEEAAGRDVYEVAGINLVRLIEEGITAGPELDSYLNEYLAIANEKKLENIVLACTHYPIIRDSIARNLDYEANIINPADKISELLDIKEDSSLDINIFMTDINGSTKKMIDGILGCEYKLHQKEI